jgi:hypothetical protein
VFAMPVPAGAREMIERVLLMKTAQSIDPPMPAA